MAFYNTDLGLAFYNTDWLWAFILHGNLTYAKTAKIQLAIEYSTRWLETAPVATLQVVEITDCTHSQDDSFESVSSGILLNALSVMTVRAQSTQNSITKLDKCFKLHTMCVTCSC